MTDKEYNELEQRYISVSDDYYFEFLQDNLSEIKEGFIQDNRKQFEAYCKDCFREFKGCLK